MGKRNSFIQQIIIVMRKGVIDKTRFEIKCGSHIYEVDEFYGENEGLIVAEIELSSETETLKDLFGWVKK
jgi:adenylate cyclase